MIPVKPIPFLFPDPALFKPVSVVALYVEPVVDSGERLCVAVLARDAERVRALPVPSLRRLRCLYGDAYRTLELAAEYSLKSLEAWANERGVTDEALATWEPPVEGMAIGPVRHTTSRSLDYAVEYYLRRYSSLAATATVQEDEAREERGASMSSSRLERLVREEVLKVKPGLEARFDRKYWVKEGVRPLRLGFAGSRLVANFSLLWPSQLSGAVRLSKSKLWDLAQARDGLTAGWFGEDHPAAFELLVQHPGRGDPVVTERGIELVREAREELEVEADKLELRSRSLESPMAMGKFVVEQELAEA